MARRPKWSLNAIREIETIYADTAGELARCLASVPPESVVYGSGYLEVHIVRDMTDAEYEREKKRRAKKRQSEKERDRKKLDQLAKKLGVEVVDAKL